MTRVDFYVLEQGDAAGHELMICRVVEKAWQRGHQVYVHCADEQAARVLDDRLWQFKDTSFVPHALDDDSAPIVIGTPATTTSRSDVLINLDQSVPDIASRFERVIESAGYDDATRSAAPDRYRYYQERGFPLHTHKVAG